MTKLIKYSFLIFACFIEAKPFESTYEPLPSENILIRNANISHGRLSRILNNLVSQGLLEQVTSKRSNRYKTSPSGREFLAAYKTFREFSDDFGLTI